MFLAFSKANVEDLTKRVPSYVKVSTLHSLGLNAIKAKQKFVKVDSNKCIDIATNILKSSNLQPTAIRGLVTKVANLVGYMKFDLVSTFTEAQSTAIKYGIEASELVLETAVETLKLSNLTTKIIDFNDMVYLPAKNNLKLDYFDIIFVDEAQDLNKAQQQLVTNLITPNNRFIAVGDPNQAIYGWAGVDNESFFNFKNFPNVVELPLSVNFRCGKRILETVKHLVPQIEASEMAIEGTVNYDAKIEDIKQKDFVLCRNTAPLVKLCLYLIKNKIKANVKGANYGKDILSLLTKSKASNTHELEIYLAQTLQDKKDFLSKNYGIKNESLNNCPSVIELNDKIDVIKTFITESDNLEYIRQSLTDIFSDNCEGVILSTIHRAKGLEAKNVFILNNNLFESEIAKKDKQNDNLIYVAYTRAKETLNFVTM